MTTRAADEELELTLTINTRVFHTAAGGRVLELLKDVKRVAQECAEFGQLRVVGEVPPAGKVPPADAGPVDAIDGKRLTPDQALAKVRAGVKLLDTIAAIARNGGRGDIVIPFMDAKLVVSIDVKVYSSGGTDDSVPRH